VRRLLLLLALALAGCGGGDEAANTGYPVETRPLTPAGEVIPPRASVTLQIPGPVDARVAGYVAAAAEGFYEDVKLDVALEPDAALERGRAEYGIVTLAELLEARDAGRDLVDVAQVFRDGGDAVAVRGDWIARPENRDLTVRFLQGSFLGWAFCREYTAACLRLVLDRNPALRRAAQRRLLDAVNARIWPNETGIGTMDPALFRRVADEALRTGAIEEPATQAAWRDDLALYAVTEGEDEDQLGTERHWDLKGQFWEPRPG
jgi:ABC-type nitrate/sulfonate/bicarbonate transport system substrate-binding protein